MFSIAAFSLEGPFFVKPVDIALAIALSFALLLVGVTQGAYMAYPLLGALGAFGLVARRHGTPWQSLVQSAWGGVRQSLAVIGILLLIGGLVALWMAAGTVPALVYWGLEQVQPRTFLLWAFVLPGVISVLIGTSFGAVSTIGVALMTMASGSAINPHLIAGAIISGAYVGDRCSPLSSSANLVAIITGTPLHDNLRAMARTGLLPVILTGLLYGLLAIVGPPLQIDRQLQADIAATFSQHWSVLLPAVVVLGAALRVPVRYTLALSIGVAAAIASMVQGFSWGELLRFTWSGFYLPEAAALAGLFQGGGVLPMIRVCGVVVVSTALAGILTQTGLLGQVRTLTKPTSKRAQTRPKRSQQFLHTGLVGTAAALFGCTQTIAILLTQRLVHQNYSHDSGADGQAAQEQALDLENTVVVLSPLVPWNIAGLVPATVLMSDAGFIPFAVYLYLQPLVVLAQLKLKR